MKGDSSKIFVALAVIVILAVLISVAGGYGGVRIGNMSLFAFCGLVAFAINWLVFIPSSFAKSEKYYDLTGGISYISVIVIAVLFTRELDTRAGLVAIMVIVWAIRLAGFLFLRIQQDGHDDRFDEIKVNSLRFFLTWSLQGLWVLLTVACALVIITNGVSKPIGLIGSIGIAMWLIGFLFECVADAQKRAFKRNPDNQNRFISSGLWAWSQHPNYFGEMLLWFGVALLALPILQGWQWMCIISPFFVVLLISRVSGIPMLQAKAQKKWGDDVDYQRYIANTPLLLPRLPKDSSTV